MTNAPENIWAITEPDDVSADILGDVYAQQVPDGMNGTPIKYIREDVALAMVAKAVEAEREACLTAAKVEKQYAQAELSEIAQDGFGSSNDIWTGRLVAAQNIAAAIEARAALKKGQDDE